MNILLITDDFYPMKGGISHTLRNLCIKLRKTQYNLYIVNPLYKAKNIFNILSIKHVNWINVIRYFKKKKNKKYN